MTAAVLELRLLAALRAVHGLLGRLLQSTYTPTAEELAEVARGALETVPRAVLVSIVLALAPLVKVWELVDRLEQLGRRFRRRPA